MELRTTDQELKLSSLVFSGTFWDYFLCPKDHDPAWALRSVSADLGACLKTDNLQALLSVHSTYLSPQVSAGLFLHLHLIPHET